ncbi:MAG: hypothetical protein M3P51_13185 [Chloroflexota bacterium]|nr:hypothetical protein [Chloroflexota bacterium]
MTSKPILSQAPNRLHNPGNLHYLDRRDLERRLDYQERLNAHLARLNRYLTARLAEVRR